MSDKINKLEQELKLISKKLHLTNEEKLAFSVTIRTLNFYKKEIENIQRGVVNE